LEGIRGRTHRFAPTGDYTDINKESTTVMEIIKKLIDNKILTGSTLAAITSFGGCILLIQQGIMGIPFYMMLSFFIITSMAVMVVSMREKTLSIKNLLKQYNITEQEILGYLQSKRQRKPLNNHKLFLSKITEYQNKISDVKAKCKHKGKAFVISNFLSSVIESFISEMEIYLASNNDNINDDSIDTDINLLINTLYGIRDVCVSDARTRHVPGTFVSLLQNDINNIVNEMVMIAKGIYKVGYSNDYDAHLHILSEFTDVLDKFMSDDNMAFMVGRNGELSDIYDKVDTALGIGVIQPNKEGNFG